MKIKDFEEKCLEGCRVRYIEIGNDRQGTVQKISKDHDKALVLFEDGAREWVEYFKLDFV